MSSLIRRQGLLATESRLISGTSSVLGGITDESNSAPPTETTFGVQMPVYRSYTMTGVPTSFTNTPAQYDWDSTNMVSIRTSVWSCKPSLTDQASGSLDAAWTSFLNTIPDGHRMYITMQHEPDQKIRKYDQGQTSGNFSLSTWQNGWDEWIAFMAAYQVANPQKHIKTYLCLTDGPWTFAQGTTNPDDYYRGNFDCWAPDVYLHYGTNYATTAEAMGAAIDYGRTKGSTSWGMPEWGVDYTSSSSNFQLNGINDGIAYINAATDCAFACYYSYTGEEDDVRPQATSLSAVQNFVTSHGGSLI